MTEITEKRFEAMNRGETNAAHDEYDKKNEAKKIERHKTIQNTR